MMSIRPTAWWPVVLFFFGTAAAHAHDTLQSSTNIWFQPDQMEVELIMARASSRILLAHPPPVPLTEDNFESAYHALYQKCAPDLLEITLDGQKMAPGSITVELFQDTDIRFDYLFPRPAQGRLRFTASFIKRMPDNFINTLGVNEGNSVLGFGNQDADKLYWEMSLGADRGSSASSPTSSMLPADSLAPPATTPAKTESPESSHVPSAIIFFGLFFLIFAKVALRWRRRNRESRPTR